MHCMLHNFSASIGLVLCSCPQTNLIVCVQFALSVSNLEAGYL